MLFTFANSIDYDTSSTPHPISVSSHVIYRIKGDKQRAKEIYDEIYDKFIKPLRPIRDKMQYSHDFIEDREYTWSDDPHGHFPIKWNYVQQVGDETYVAYSLFRRELPMLDRIIFCEKLEQVYEIKLGRFCREIGDKRKVEEK